MATFNRNLPQPKALAPRALLRWAGSKRMLLSVIKPLVPTFFGRYIEPFAGSASLFFAIQPQEAILGDTNASLVEFLKEVQKNPKAVYKIANNIPKDSVSYYKVRAASAKKSSRILRAARFYYLNRFCFNGIYRTNEKGVFNVPYSGSRNGKFPSLEEFLTLVDILKRARIVSTDFEATVREHARSGDFVYLDPPYAVSNRRIFREYGQNSFGTADVGRLASLLREMDQRNVRFILSYAYCAEAIEAFRSWPKRKLFAQRNVSGFARNRRLAAELLVTNSSLGESTN